MTEFGSALLLEQLLRVIDDKMTLDQKIERFASIFNQNKRNILIINGVGFNRLFAEDATRGFVSRTLTHKMSKIGIKVTYHKTKRGVNIKFKRIGKTKELQK
jgi:hypothetical protein